jgi:hypothetical protein
VKTRFLLIAVLAFTGPLRAQLSYVGDVTLPAAHDYILPQNGIMPAVLVDNSNPRPLFTVSYPYDLTANPDSLNVAGYPGTKLTTASLTAYPGYNSTAGNIYLTGPQRGFYVVNVPTESEVRYTLSIVIITGTINTLAATGDATPVLVTNNQIYQLTLNNNNDAASATVLIDSIGNGGRLGTAGHGTFGPDGLFYVLNQVNGVTSVESYDLANAGLFKNSFTVPSNTSLSGGMAISPTGHMYLGDGAGGLSEYDLNGNLLANFSYTGGGTDNSATGGASFVSLDHLGDIFVYDSTTGMHEYFDATAIPEPATYAAIFGVAALVLAAWRRRPLNG